MEKGVVWLAFERDIGICELGHVYITQRVQVGNDSEADTPSAGARLKVEITRAFHASSDRIARADTSRAR
jgi:hypothetical protein